MPEVLDLRQFRPEQLDALLDAEAAEWRRELHWDYAGSLELIRQYIAARVLPGFVLADGSPQKPRPRGYGFFVYESHKGLIGDVFLLPSLRASDRGEEKRLLGHMIETLQATPGLQRIEAQLMSFRPEELASEFARWGFHAHRRLFLLLPLERAAAVPAPDLARPWTGVGFDRAAALIHEAYAHHVDSRINDQYRTLGGSVRFLQNVIHYPGCGQFDEESSGVVPGEDAAGRLAGLLLASRVRPEVAHVTQVCVAPRYRGRGLARALFQRAIASLRGRGFSALSLTVTEANRPALELYRRMGFTTLREFDAYVWERPMWG